MGNSFNSLSRGESRRVLITSALDALKDEGFDLKKKRGMGRGPSQVYIAKRDGKEQLLSIRTTRNRWFAFPPFDGGWKTLDDVDLVAVSAVDNPENPEKAEVYLFSAKSVRDKLDAEHAVRKANGYVITENVGLWIYLDPIEDEDQGSMGSGLASDETRIAEIPFDEGDVFSFTIDAQAPEDQLGEPTKKQGKIPDILLSARKSIAHLAGVDIESVKLELRIEI